MGCCQGCMSTKCYLLRRGKPVMQTQLNLTYFCHGYTGRNARLTTEYRTGYYFHLY